MNGWNEDKLEGLLSVLETLEGLTYEVRNCIRGAYSGKETYEELGQYVKMLGNQLIEEGSYIAEEVEEDEEDE